MIRIRLGLILVFSTLSFGLAQHRMTGMVMDDELSKLEGAPFEIAFMSGMIAHHEGATEMARWILGRTKLPGVAADAQQIIAAQEPEIKLMKSWLGGWYQNKQDAKAAAVMARDMQGMLGDMASYKSPDAAFLSEMSAHHNSAVDMAQLALTKAVHPKLRELAKDIIRNQVQEIADYQETLAELKRR